MQNTNEDVVEIDLQELFMLLMHWLWLILLCGIAAGCIGFTISNYLLTPQYQSTTKVYILNKQDNSTLSYSDVQLGTQLTKDYAQLIKGRTVLEKVIETYGLNEGYGSFSQRVTVATLTDTRIIAITVEDPDPAMAQILADEIRVVASEHIKNVMDIQAVNVAEEANLPTSPSSPNVMKWTALGFAVGFFLCAMVVIIRFLMDDTVKSSEDIERYLGLSTLAMIPIMEGEQKSKYKNGKKSSHMKSASSEYKSDSSKRVESTGKSLEAEELGKSSAAKEEK